MSSAGRITSRLSCHRHEDRYSRVRDERQVDVLRNRLRGHAGRLLVIDQGLTVAHGYLQLQVEPLDLREVLTQQLLAVFAVESLAQHVWVRDQLAELAQMQDRVGDRDQR